MTPEIIITIPGKPIAMVRHRHTKGHTYDPQAEIKEDISWIIHEQWGKALTFPPVPLSGAIGITLHFYMPIAPSLSKKKQTQFYLDTCSGTIYYDDAQVYTLKATKTYSHNPRTEIIITQPGEHNE
ncbi:MAG: RusA family crossover junction endodeoxyribonuclease [Deltaproteobacteria bacterium]|nr:RusA family crossover junction endodeoxyribonuclease [Deltaproteobacteria bacterium]